MMPEKAIPPWFWELLASTGRNLRSLCRQLEVLPQERLRQYRAAFDKARALVDPYLEWEECVEYISDWPSEDGANDFSAWVVAQGRDFFLQVRGDPAHDQRYLDLFGEVEMKRHPDLQWDESVDRDEYRGYQRADTIATPIYRARFGGNVRS